MKLSQIIKVGVIASVALGFSATALAGACNLKNFESDSSVTAKLNVSEDPIGLALEAKQKGGDVKSVIADYAHRNNCTLHTIAMFDLVKGLMKGSTFPGGNDPAASSDIAGKYLIVEEDKAACAKKLDLKLPIKEMK